MEADVIKLVNGMFEVLEILFPKGDALQRLQLDEVLAAEKSDASPASEASVWGFVTGRALIACAGAQ